MNNRIRELRKAEKLTQKELAIKVGVRRETIAYLESGSYSPSLELAYILSRYFNKEIEDLFLFED